VLFNDIESAVAELADARAGWVHRRDAAEALGRAAGQALTALRAHEDDADVDVRAIVQKVLGQASAELIRVFTYCGAESEEALEWALEANMKLSHCALALTHDEDNRRFVLTRCFLAEAARPEQVKAAVKEIAFYGDWIEKKLTGLDEL